MTTCNVRIRPIRPVNEVEISCDRADDGHTEHSGYLRDYVRPGSATIVTWFDGDRRSFDGEWPGACALADGCILPAHHLGGHAF